MSGGGMERIGSFNPALLVDGGRTIELHREIPVEGKIKARGRITGVYDKGSGAVVATESESVDAATGEPMFTLRANIFLRGEGGFGGDRGPSGPRNAPPDRAPDESVTYETRPDQALTYRLSGDRNPLHADPEFAKMAGFPKPILHGLCTYGFTGRALLHTLCGSDPAKFKRMEGRFSKPVFPGDALTVNMWVDGNEAVFQTVTQNGDAVIDQGSCTFLS
jgi:acyl dehydratase